MKEPRHERIIIFSQEWNGFAAGNRLLCSPTIQNTPFLLISAIEITGSSVARPWMRDAIYPLARDHLAFAEQVQTGLIPHKVSEIWLFASSNAEISVDISSGFERKVAARLVHESQTPDPAALVASWRARSASIRRGANLALAEAFTRLEIGYSPGK